MKHEKFKLLHTVEGGEIEGDPEIQDFLNSGITPKSVSINHGLVTDTVIIGYTEESTEHNYQLLYRKVQMESTVTTEEVEKALEDEAASVGGIICQDVTVEDYGLSIVFLTTL